MEYQLWKAIVTLFRSIDNSPFDPNLTFTSEVIVKVWFWAVIHDRPVSWACERRNWPIWARRCELPSSSTMCRRLRTKTIRNLISSLEARITQDQADGNIVWMIDGKPLPISGCTKDRQAGYGRAAGTKAKGYKLHAIVGSDGQLAAWKVAPMNKDERVMARRMLKTMSAKGYVLADSNYDSNKLHAICDERENLQLICTRRYGKGAALGNRKQAIGRLRSKDILEDPFNEFGNQLLEQREEIERFFGNLTNWGGGLAQLPSWVRNHGRVERWVQAKLIINYVKRNCRI